MNFRYGSAIDLARTLQAKHPEWLVCGSLALMLGGYMKVRRLSDIDFATPHFSSIPKFERLYRTEYKNDASEKYYHVSSGEGWDLFVHDEITHQPGFYHNLRLQNIQEVLHWKRIFNREKDQIDLAGQYLPEELFEI
jgi:hypothetical protein